MTAPSVSLRHLQPLFLGLLDDAAVFPPGNTPMRSALHRYAVTRKTPGARLVGSLVCSSDRLDELLRQMPPELGSLDLSLVVVGGAEAVGPAVEAANGSQRLVLRSVELSSRPSGVGSSVEALLAQLAPDVAGYVELEPGVSFGPDAQVVAAAGQRVKLRGGGASAANFPSEQDLAGCIVACLQAAVPFKLTAGLHRAVRHADSMTGFQHHGFLNVLVAVASRDSSVNDVAATLAEPDGGVLAECIRSWSVADITRVRERFVSFGTCSTSEAADDLRALALIPQETP